LLGEPTEAAEKDGEDQRRRDWLDNRPQRAEDRLLVADFDVAPDNCKAKR
jgi:hypothetical protein